MALAAGTVGSLFPVQAATLWYVPVWVTFKGASHLPPLTNRSAAFVTSATPSTRTQGAPEVSKREAMLAVLVASIARYDPGSEAAVAALWQAESAPLMPFLGD